MAKTMHVRTLLEDQGKTAENCSFLSAECPSAAAPDTSAAAPGNSALALDLGSGSGRVGPPGRVGSDAGSGQTRKIKLKIK